MLQDLLILGAVSLLVDSLFSASKWFIIFGSFYFSALVTGTFLHFQHPGFRWETYVIGIALISFGSLLNKSSIPSGKLLMVIEGHESAVTAVAFSPDASFIASGSKDSSVRIWEVASGKQVCVLQGHNGSVNAVSFNSDGTLLASVSSDESIRIWRMPSGRLFKVLRINQRYIGGPQSLAWHPKRIELVCSCGWGTRPVIWRWNESLRTVTNDVTASMVAYGGNGSIIAFADQRKKVYVMKNNQLETLHKAKGSVIAFEPGGYLLAVANENPLEGHRNSISMWNCESGQRVVKLRGHMKDITSLSFEPESSLLASGSRDQRIAIWNWDLRKREYYLRGHTEAVNTVCFCAKGRLLASGGDDTTIRLWQVY